MIVADGKAHTYIAIHHDHRDGDRVCGVPSSKAALWVCTGSITGEVQGSAASTKRTNRMNEDVLRRP
jgi:hypothetical protein